ncbi:UNVERIFIED_CONTAM: hypothetical protein GTU68_063100, partial [Idotea baltica]|nr:hypothetical protein [Idotea baltica]
SPSWGREQPNNYNGEQNCVVLDRDRDWLWNDVGCNLNYLNWMCQFRPSCGNPDRKLNTTVTIQPTSNDTIAVYECPIGSKVQGIKERICSPTGYWSGEAPSCKYIDCGKPSSIENGVLSLLDGRTNYGSKTKYVCAENYTMDGNDTVVCGDDGEWEPRVPECLYSWCSELEAPMNGLLKLSGRRSGDTAEFTCDPGYFMVGQETLSCALGGKWSGTPPNCQFVDCGLPETMEHGKMTLVNSTTYVGSMAVYECEDDYWLEGHSIRVCENNGHWQGDRPSCKLISCSEPYIPIGGYITGYGFEVHSEVQYHCEAGHYMTGIDTRVCNRDRQWTGTAPNCTFVDCGRLAPIIKGELAFDSQEAHTHLDAQVHYKCMPNYRLIGEELRVCQKNGVWSGDSPRCEEIRCSEPESPEKSRITVTGNDRRASLAITRTRHQLDSNVSYKVGSQVAYRCERGYKVDGFAIRTCLANGTWSADAPKCIFTDCGLPPSVDRGIFRLLSNETIYGAVVAYECENNWKIKGKVRRHCQENGTWSGEYPECIGKINL